MIFIRPQDVVLLLKLGIEGSTATTLAALGAQLGISAAEIHGAMNRASLASLLDRETRKPRIHNLLEFLEHGIKYAFVSRRGELTRGLPTAYSAPPLSDVLMQGPVARMFLNPAAEPPSSYETSIDPYAPIAVVWPDPEGKVRGESLEPLYPAAVGAARRDPKLYECLALVDALRIGRAREKKLAIAFLTERLRPA